MNLKRVIVLLAATFGLTLQAATYAVPEDSSKVQNLGIYRENSLCIFAVKADGKKASKITAKVRDFSGMSWTGGNDNLVERVPFTWNPVAQKVKNMKDAPGQHMPKFGGQYLPFGGGGDGGDGELPTWKLETQIEVVRIDLKLLKDRVQPKEEVSAIGSIVPRSRVPNLRWKLENNTCSASFVGETDGKRLVTIVGEFPGSVDVTVYDSEMTDISETKTLLVGDAFIAARRVSYPAEEQFLLKKGEHFEVNGTFEYELKNYGGDTTVVTYELLEVSSGDLLEGPGTKFERTWTGADVGTWRIRFMLGELELLRRTVQVKNTKFYGLTSTISTNCTTWVVSGWGNREALLRPAQVIETFEGATKILMVKDGAIDWRACANLYSTSIRYRRATSKRCDPISKYNAIGLQRWYHLADVTFIGDIGGPKTVGLNVNYEITKNFVEPISAFQELPDGRPILAFSPRYTGAVLGHEVGHGLGLEHKGDRDYLMTGVNLIVPDWYLHNDEVDVFEGE